MDETYLPLPQTPGLRTRNITKTGSELPSSLDAIEEIMAAAAIEKKEKEEHDVAGLESTTLWGVPDDSAQRPNSQTLEQIRQATESRQQEEEQDGGRPGGAGENRILTGLVTA